MDYDIVKSRIERALQSIKQLGGDAKEMRIERPATSEEIAQAEMELGVKLPHHFKKVLMEFSKDFDLRWFLPENLEAPEEFRSIFSGRFHWNLSLLSQMEEGRKGWIENVFPDPANAYDAVWHNKLAFCEVGNGDYLAFDMKNPEEAAIVYLSHDDGEGHGWILANHFIELLENWSQLAFVGSEDWQWVPFTADSTSGILPNSEAAKRFREWLGISI